MSTEGQRDWWRDGGRLPDLPRSFADANGDGIGDLAGVTEPAAATSRSSASTRSGSRPFYPSPLADGGYDITDYRDVDPRLGTLEDFDALVDAGARARHSGSSIDIVPNHTSEPASLVPRPRWPPAPARRNATATSSATAPARTASARRPDWRSHFGGSRLAARSPTASGTATCSPANSPTSTGTTPRCASTSSTPCGSGPTAASTGSASTSRTRWPRICPTPCAANPTSTDDLPLDGTDPLYDRDEVHEIYRSWRAVFNEYDPPRMAVAETWHPTSARTYLYARPTSSARSSTSPCSRPHWDADQFPQRHPAVHGGPPGRRRRPHVGAVQPRRSPTRDPLRAARPA